MRVGLGRGTRGGESGVEERREGRGREEWGKGSSPRREGDNNCATRTRYPICCASY